MIDKLCDTPYYNNRMFFTYEQILRSVQSCGDISVYFPACGAGKYTKMVRFGRFPFYREGWKWTARSLSR